jgi:predicted ATPase
MILRKLCIHNFKSLRNVTFEPSPLSVLVGPNASGKTNFASAVHFLSEVYSLGLEMAISRAGGYENIVFRKQRKAKTPIKFEIEFETNAGEIRGIFHPTAKSPYTLRHEFSITASGSDVRSDFRVQEESFLLNKLVIRNGDIDYSQVFELRRQQNQITKIGSQEGNPLFNPDYWKEMDYLRLGSALHGQELTVNSSAVRQSAPGFFSIASRFAVYQVSPDFARMPGVPTPNPKLLLTGENLPALVDWLQRNYPTNWNIVMSGMRDVLPTLEEISVEQLYNKTQGLFFHEEGIGTAWTARDISDGTIQALALLTAAADPRHTLLLIEEPETSSHPWVLRTIVENLRVLSKDKNVILTTHSPILVDMMHPDEVWILWRKDGESHMKKLTEIDENLQKRWLEGKSTLSTYLDSGAIGQAVPGGVFENRDSR